MKVYIGPYKNYVSPYTIAAKMLFWKDEDSEIVDTFGEWLSTTWVNSFCAWIDTKRSRTVKVRIDNYDVWNMDSTLAHIILPMLKKLQNTKSGAPYVDDDDVPEHLRKSSAPPTENEWDVDDNHFKRWDYVLGEMIIAFESKNTEWEVQFWKALPKIDFKKYPEDEGKSVVPIRWEEPGECDWEGYNAYQQRIDNGFRLFGKYYNSLWT